MCANYKRFDFSTSLYQQFALIKLARCILAVKRADPQADVRRWERELDCLVYELYELTDDEIAIVEGSTKR
ncbi:MAG: hypothetical protein M3Q91_11480 [Acidobacteriota bacterium]|nr:hypothetical protein [Acidobacteriota bacterium]